MEREGRRFRPGHRALQIIQEFGLALEQVGDVVENFDLVVEGVDEGRKVALCGCGNHLLANLLDFFFRRHMSHLPCASFFPPLFLPWMLRTALASRAECRRFNRGLTITSEVMMLFPCGIGPIRGRAPAERTQS